MEKPRGRLKLVKVEKSRKGLRDVLSIPAGIHAPVAGTE